MIFRQLFDRESCTYSYLVGEGRGGAAFIVDPVLEGVEHYLRLLRELELTLVKAIDTHLHADHVTGLAVLRDRTRCITVMGAQSAVDRVSMRLHDGDRIEVGALAFEAIYTPGHTDDSYCLRMADRVFTGDTLLIRGTGRTDFQHGDAHAAYRSITTRLLVLPDETLVYPAHDYKGDTVSTIGEERAFNPRLQVASADEYAALMSALGLPDPKLMDVAVPANRQVGLSEETLALQGWSLAPPRAIALLGGADVLLVDLREDAERARDGTVPGSLHLPYPTLAEKIRPGGVLSDLAASAGRRIVFFCSYGERSAMAVQAAHEAGLAQAQHIEGGIQAWKAAGGPLGH